MNNDNVQNHPAIAKRLRTESPPGGQPLFFIGSSPSMANKILSPDYPAAGVMISANALQRRKSDFKVGRWILDSGAFTEVSRHGGYRASVQGYYDEICRWSRCGKLLIAVAQDWMCEPFVLERTGLTVIQHQDLTLKRYDELLKLNPPVPIMPVIQGYQSSEYLVHLLAYGDRLNLGAWVGIGSVCRRNSNPGEIINILKTIKTVRPDLQLHGFGLKMTALESREVRELLYSCDSQAWSYPLRFRNPGPGDSLPGVDSVQNRLTVAYNYQQKISEKLKGDCRRPTPRTAGAGNGQGRKGKWRSKTIAIRVPEKFVPELLKLARDWDAKN